MQTQPPQPGAPYPPQPGAGYPPQFGAGYQQQPAGGYPQQPAGGYPQQLGYAYPQQPGGVQQTTVVPGPAVSAVYQQSVYPDVDVKSCKKSGGAQINIGLLAVIFGIISICIDCEFSYYGTAIWGGFWFIVTGFLGASVPSARGSNVHCQLTGYLVLGVFSAIYALDLMILTSVAISEEKYAPTVNNNYYVVTSSRAARVAIDSILLILGILELFISCWGVGVAGKHVCGTSRQTVVTTQPAVVQYTTTTTTPGYPQYPQPQPAIYATQIQPGPSVVTQGDGTAPPSYQEKPQMG